MTKLVIGNYEITAENGSVTIVDKRHELAKFQRLCVVSQPHFNSLLGCLVMSYSEGINRGLERANEIGKEVNGDER